MSPRYGQLSYTSFDAAGGLAGGWQVKEATGELSPVETEPLVAGVRTVFDAIVPLPAYPTPADQERGPRRLAYQHLGELGAGYWHTVPAGSDGTGRPGNVFAHVVLDRVPDEAAGDRPIAWWRAPKWVRPYGAAEVARAVLPPEPPAPADVVDAASVVAFVLDASTWRLGILCVLLDAVAAALDGGAKVVLGVTSDESAAQWIGAVSYLMSPGTARRLSFSTFDRAAEVSADGRFAQHLTAVPASELALVAPHAVVIDETTTPSMGELDGEPHRTADGVAITVTPWSVMAQVTLIDPVSAHTVMSDVDRYAAQAGDVGLHPAWPMAMAVLHRDDFADARAEATAVAARFSPVGLGEESTVGRAVRGALDDLLGASAADAWNVLRHESAGAFGDRAQLEYLRRAINDIDWLTQPGRVPAGPGDWSDRVLPAELAEAVGPALDRAAAVGPVPLVRLVDLLWSAGVPDGRSRAALADPLVTGALIDPRTGPDFAYALGERIGWPTRLALSADVLYACGPGDDATTPLTDHVLGWLAGEVGVPAPGELAAAAPWDPTWTRAALRGAYAARFGATGAGDGFAQLWWLRLCGSDQFDELAGGAIWDPAELTAASHGRPLQAQAVLTTLLGAADSPAMEQLAAAVLEVSPDPVASACAALRAIDLRVWARGGTLADRQRDCVPLWRAAIERAGLTGLHLDCGVRLLVLAVIADVSGLPHPPETAALAADPDTAEGAIARVLALVEGDDLPAARVLAAALIPRSEDRMVGVEGLVETIARQLVVVYDFADPEVDAVVAAMADMTGTSADEAPRRYRRMVHKMLAIRPEERASLTARIRGGR